LVTSPAAWIAVAMSSLPEGSWSGSGVAYPATGSASARSGFAGAAGARLGFAEAAGARLGFAEAAGARLASGGAEAGLGFARPAGFPSPDGVAAFSSATGAAGRLAGLPLAALAAWAPWAAVLAGGLRLARRLSTFAAAFSTFAAFSPSLRPCRPPSRLLGSPLSFAGRAAPGRP
jgi:hypothetical protein